MCASSPFGAVVWVLVLGVLNVGVVVVFFVLWLLLVVVFVNMCFLVCVSEFAPKKKRRSIHLATLETEGKLNENDADGVENDYLHQVLDLQTEICEKEKQLSEKTDQVAKLRERVQYAVLVGDAGFAEDCLKSK